MNKSNDPFDVAFEESPPESPLGQDETESHILTVPNESFGQDSDANAPFQTTDASTSSALVISAGRIGKPKEDEEEEDEEQVDVEIGKVQPSVDPSKMVKMQAILSRFTEDQMSRYESFRRSGFQKSVMRRLLTSITGNAKISMPMTIVVSGIAKIFVGEMIEAAKIVMAERGESGPIRPCHIRESYRRLKLAGKIPKRSVPRLFR